MWLDREALAERLSVRVDGVARLQRRGVLPAPSYRLGPRSPRWWAPDVDAAMGREVASRGRTTLAEALTTEAGR
jgi:predicted DNA-binding transcriptional regulator AlpA